ncbi:MAG TPA: VacJ family lipoprotein [Steroidobacteraceae bacterium]
MIVYMRAGAGALTALLLALAGCATTGATTSGDPLERMNRGTHRFNDAVDRAVLKPVATGYRNHVPQLIQTGVDNVLDHLAFPTTIVNDLLQLKIKDTLIDLGRFAVNTTLGIGGLLDPASSFGIPRNDEDFGQTLGRWGVPAGPYLVLPFFGPSSVRDAPSIYADAQTDLRVALDLDSTTEWGLAGLSFVNRRAELLPFDPSFDSAYDRYAFIRDAWLQRREYQVKDGDVPGGEISPEELEELEREMQEPEAPAAPENTEDQPPPATMGSSSSETSLMPASAEMAGGTWR